ncbi:hypothetical protein DP83_12425 [Vibrio metoecus]|uniref:HTH lysR-type domain-containing protein n=1 Tax=Vibrio metoecus TaxID=1481663 RepID=A0ABR4RV44_VIBMT|nr:hypothetical protein DP83_12425 [Vibrio metoecus]
MLLEGIETLLVLSKEKTMSRTGSQLYISQSAVSKRIANLEKNWEKTDCSCGKTHQINGGCRTVDC